MQGCYAPGAMVEISDSNNPRRKLRYTLERVDMGAGWIGVNTSRVNAIVAEAVMDQRIEPLSAYTKLHREPAFAAEGIDKGRFDLKLSADGRRTCLVEIKNATLLREGEIQFPDAVSKRGLKHLHLLEKAAHSGFRACLVFALNRPESDRFRPAEDIDPDYAAGLYHALEAGVEVILARLVHGDDAISIERGWQWLVDDNKPQGQD